MRYAILSVATVTIIGVALGLSVWDRFTAALREPAGTSALPVVVILEEGDTLETVLPRLVEREVVRNPDLVRRYIRDFHEAKQLIPGEYAVTRSMGAAEVIAHLESGRVMKRPVNIPEGATLRSVAKILEKAEIVQQRPFLAAGRDRALLGRLGVPGPTAEGYLLPEVYSFARNTPAETVVEVMVSAFIASFQRSVGDETNGLTHHEVVTLASLIELAPYPRSERRALSAMVRNRLRAGIPLHMEAVTAYAENADPSVRAKFDTFSRPGLPAGPICSPGTSAILAAANPGTSRALYAVTRNDGSHVFCDDLDCFYEMSQKFGRPLPRRLPLPVPEGPQGPVLTPVPVEPLDEPEPDRPAPVEPPGFEEAPLEIP